MRDSLRHSIADTPAQGFEKYPKGSIVLCNACAKPIFKLDRGLDLGARTGQAASAFKPLSFFDLEELSAREDIDAGLRALVRSWTPEQKAAHLQSLCEMRSGDPMLCPCCKDCFVQVLGVTAHEVMDKAYTIEMLTVPPFGAAKPSPVRGRRLGTNKNWIHERAKPGN